MRKRLFISIPLAAEVRDALAREAGNLQPRLPRARFLASECWHLTVLFLGHHGIEWVPAILNAIEATAARTSAPRVRIERMAYGPEGRPRMLWAWGSGETATALGAVKELLERELFSRGLRFQRAHRPFTPHVTLARFPGDEARLLPPLERWVTHAYRAERIALMESHLGPGGAAYEELASFAFRE